MSASPSGQSVGHTPTPNGGQPQFVRKAKVADPLRPRKKPVRRAPISQPVGNRPAGAPLSTHPGNPRPNAEASYPVSQEAVGGWTVPPAPGTYTDYKLFTTKRQMREGMRYHIAKFTSKKPVDPRNQDEFTRPLLLHRRDPKAGPPGKDKDEKLEGDVLEDTKEREKQELLRQAKEEQKAKDQAQIAPSGGSSNTAAKKAQAFRNEKTTQVHRLDKTAEEKKASDLRYEEALPWHLEDADNKNTWVGNYESALSETNVAFVQDGDRFYMVPIEKWYKFIPVGQFKVMTTEEAEASMNKKTKESRWALRDIEKDAGKKESEKAYKAMHTLYAVKAESGTFKNSGKRETEDMDELDFDGDDLFQDDDELNTVEKVEDEETKEAQEKIKRDQMNANLFGAADEAEVDKEIREELEEMEMAKQLSKGVKKALRKRERNLAYAEDSDSDPYAEKDANSDDETSDEEKQMEIDRKKDEEAKNKLANADSKGLSGASSKGTNTPSGHQRHGDPLKKGIKRPGSPNLSESSGNESLSRKKLKKKFHSSQPTGSSTPMPGSRGASPAPSTQPGMGSRKPSVLKINNHAHPSAMDIDTPGGEASDGGHKKKKLKLTINSPGGSRAGSRVGSPAPHRAGSASGSRPGSPAHQSNGNGSPDRIQREDISRVLRQQDGISIKDLIAKFKPRLDGPGQLTQKEIIQQIKEVAKYGPDKLLRIK